MDLTEMGLEDVECVQCIDKFIGSGRGPVAGSCGHGRHMGS